MRLVLTWEEFVVLAVGALKQGGTPVIGDPQFKVSVSYEGIMDVPQKPEEVWLELDTK